jgi:hypothetical protein
MPSTSAPVPRSNSAHRAFSSTCDQYDLGRNSYAPSRDGQRFLVNVALDSAVPPINVDLD